MESMIVHNSQLAELCCQVNKYKNVIMLLQDIMAEKARCQSRYDQVQCLDTLRGRVEREVQNMRRMEATASNGFVKGSLIVGAVEFSIASFIAWIGHSNEHPLSVGARWATSWEGDKPFGTIVVAIGPGGVPDDVEVIPLSQLAREQNCEEAVVTAALEASYRLVTPESFYISLNKLKEKVLKGTVTLPANVHYSNNICTFSKQPTIG